VARVGQKAPKFIDVLDWHAGVKNFTVFEKNSRDFMNIFEKIQERINTTDSLNRGSEAAARIEKYLGKMKLEVLGIRC
jgi:hypothetical protein